MTLNKPTISDVYRYGRDHPSNPNSSTGTWEGNSQSFFTNALGITSIDRWNHLTNMVTVVSTDPELSTTGAFHLYGSTETPWEPSYVALQISDYGDLLATKPLPINSNWGWGLGVGRAVAAAAYYKLHYFGWGWDFCGFEFDLDRGNDKVVRWGL